MIKSRADFFKSTKFAVIALILGLIGIAMKTASMITWEEYLSGQYPIYSTWNNLAFFTYTTNILVDFWLILTSVSIFFKIEKMHAFLTHSSVRGLVTSMIFFVGALFCAVILPLSGFYSGDLWWANLWSIWHHMVTPVFMTVLWFYHSGKQELKKKDPIIWLSYPMAYLIFTMVRGSIILNGNLYADNPYGVDLNGEVWYGVGTFYPYAFLDPNFYMFEDLGLNGPVTVAIIVILMFFMFLGLVALFMKLHNKRLHKRRPWGKLRA